MTIVKCSTSWTVVLLEICRKRARQRARGKKKASSAALASYTLGASLSVSQSTRFWRSCSSAPNTRLRIARWRPPVRRSGDERRRRRLHRLVASSHSANIGSKMGPPRGRGKGRPAGSSGRGGKTNTPRVQRDRSHYAGPGFSEIPASAVDQARGQGSDEGGSDGESFW